VGLPTTLSLSQFGKHAAASDESGSDRESDDGVGWKPSRSLAKECKKICVYSDSRVVLTSAAKVKFGRVLFKRRLCRRQRFFVQGDILSFLRKNGQRCRVTRVVT
jgi:hypothetical protein